MNSTLTLAQTRSFEISLFDDPEHAWHRPGAQRQAWLLHPSTEPWLHPEATGCRVQVLSVLAQPDGLWLRAEPHNEEHLISMHPVARAGAYTVFEAILPWDEGNHSTLYTFKMVHAGRQLWLAADGVHPRMPGQESLFRLQRDQQPPAWVKHQVAYQIFPDRFHAGRPELAVQNDEYQYGSGRMRVVKKAWGEPIDHALAATAFYGGDLPGITEKLDYLHDELGVTMLYLNPIFCSGSNHRYDTDDYFQVDPHLGGNAALVDLRQALHQRGMRLVLDAVVNHTSTLHPWFNQRGTHATLGAAQSPASPWRDWYTFSETGQHAGWNGYSHLPVLNFAHPGVQEAVYAGDNAILRHWLRPPYAIDGWRFDVIHMIGEGPGAWNNSHYVRALRQTLRSENAEAYVMGEHFGEATRWLQGEQEDGAMNYYGFALPVRAWLAGLDIAYQPVQLETPDFLQWLQQALARIPYANQLAQINLLDSHDTMRMLTMLGGNLNKMQLAITLLCAFPGVPCIYYGDEIGLEGGRDPDCRRCFDWHRPHWQQDLWQHTRAMIALRRQRQEWQEGAWLPLAVQGEAFAFARVSADAVSVLAFNRGDQAETLTLDLRVLPLAVTSWVDAQGQSCAAPHVLVVPAQGWQILLSQSCTERVGAVQKDVCSA